MPGYYIRPQCNEQVKYSEWGLPRRLSFPAIQPPSPTELIPFDTCLVFSFCHKHKHKHKYARMPVPIRQDRTHCLLLGGKKFYYFLTQHMHPSIPASNPKQSNPIQLPSLSSHCKLYRNWAKQFFSLPPPHPNPAAQTTIESGLPYRTRTRTGWLAKIAPGEL